MAQLPPPGTDEEIRIVPHDEKWAALFAHEAAGLSATIGQYVTGGIHHVGSTAVPGLAAKPVIDILVGIESLEAARPCIDLVAPLDYVYFPYLADEMLWFCKPDPSRRTHHLHLAPTGSRRFMDELAFRDYLRTQPGRAHEYERLKSQLAATYKNDREAYTQGKTDFVLATLERARGQG